MSLEGKPMISRGFNRTVIHQSAGYFTALGVVARHHIAPRKISLHTAHACRQQLLSDSIRTRTASSSNSRRPEGCSIPASHCLRALCGRLSVFSQVPTLAPAATLFRMLSTLPDAITVSVPERAASRAARSFVTIPPRPRMPPSPAMSSNRTSSTSHDSISFAAGLRRGSSSQKPS